MEYLLCPNNHLFFAYAAPKKITEKLYFIRLLGKKPKLAIIIFSRPCDRNSYQTLDLEMNLCSWCPERHDKAIRDHKKRGQIAMSRHTNSHIYIYMLPTTDKSNERLLRLDTG